MSEDRPLPQYGEYATPAEVAAARGPVPQPEPTQSAAPPASAPAFPGAPPLAARPMSRPVSKPVSRWDRPLTIALLAAGVVNVAGSTAVYLDLARSVRKMFEQLGYPGLVLDNPQLPALGIAMLVSDSVLILAAIGLSAWLMTRGRRAVWVPLVAFVVHGIVINLLLFPVVLNDPGYLSLLHNLS